MEERNYLIEDIDIVYVRNTDSYWGSFMCVYCISLHWLPCWLSINQKETNIFPNDADRMICFLQHSVMENHFSHKHQ